MAVSDERKYGACRTYMQHDVVRTESRPGSTQAHLRPSGLFLRKVLIHSDVTDFGRCQEQIGQGQKERRQIAGGGGSHGVVAQKHAEVRERCLVHVPASRGQPTKVGPNAGRGEARTSSGKPSARSQKSCARTPKARPTPKSTV